MKNRRKNTLKPPLLPSEKIASGAMYEGVPIWDSLITEVLFDGIEEAMPKSISFKLPPTRRKLAGFKSKCTIPERIDL